MKKNTFIISILALAFWACGPERPANINLEQTHNPLAQHILAPGFGTMGLIGDGAIHVYFQDEAGRWIVDEGSRFDLPARNRGVISMGMATIGVAEGRMLNFYRISDNEKWEMVEGLSFELPRRFDRLLSMNLNWEMALLGVVTGNQTVFYHYDGTEWQEDDSIFISPEGIEAHYPMGDMTLVIRDRKKVGLYYHVPGEGWEFFDYDPYVMLLPEGGVDGLIPVETRMLSLLKDGVLSFYQLDLTNERWNLLDGSDFELPW